MTKTYPKFIIVRVCLLEDAADEEVSFEELLEKAKAGDSKAQSSVSAVYVCV